MSGLPTGWTITNAIEIAEPIRGVTYKKEQTSSVSQVGFTAVLRANNIQENKIDISDLVYVPNSNISENQRLKENDIVIAMSSGSISVVGKSAQIHDRIDASFGAFCGALRPSTQITPKYLGHFLKSEAYRSAISNLARGVNINNLKWSHFKEIEIPLAPLPEQKRIADKLDTVLARVDTCRDRLNRVILILKRFRQSVLAAATSGQLTADWREQQVGWADAGSPTSRDTDASWASQAQPNLLRTPRQLLENNASHLRSKLKGKRLEEILALFGQVSFNCPDLPDDWACCSIGTIGLVSNGSTPSRADDSFWDGEIPWVSSGEVRNNIIHATRERITKKGFDSSSVRLLPEGTVLIAMIGEGKTRGQSAILKIKATINQNVAAVIPLNRSISSEYLWYSFQAKYVENRTEGNGTGPQALNCQRVRELSLNLPSLPEQHEIVRRVETLFAFADRLEARLATARAATERLTPALLAKAFRGELVPQDPADEPAAALLQRLAASRADAGSKPRRARAAKV